MLALAFEGFVVLTAALVVATVARFVSTRSAVVLGTALGVWFLYVGVLASTGVLQNTTARPPGPVFVLAPMVLCLTALLLRPSASARIVKALPLSLLLAMQSFRIGVELFLHALWSDGLIPRTLTFSGANVDIYIGISAVPAAWIAQRFSWGHRVALAWNIAGLLALGNVVIRALLTAPGPFNVLPAEVPNRLLSTFPYALVPGFFVPLAVTSHVMAIRKPGFAVRSKQQEIC